MDEIRNYTLRARVIEGTLPMPQVSGPTYKDLQADNYEIFCPYTTDNLHRLFEIGREAYLNGSLSKFEIMGWAGGAANDDGVRFLWSFRPDKYNFERIPSELLENFYSAVPRPMDDMESHVFDRFWRPLKYGFSLGSYESSALNKDTVSLSDKIHSSESRNTAPSRTQAHPTKPSLDEIISSTNERRDNHGASMFICLTANKEERTWSANAANLELMNLTGATAVIDDKNKQIVISGPDAGDLFSAWSTQLNNFLYSSGRRDRMDYSMTPAIGSYAGAMPFVKEQDYPVKVYFERTDINGSSIMECESCCNREELLSLLNWIGKAGFIPVECWDFSIEKMEDPMIQNMFQAGLQRRYEEASKAIDEMLEDDWIPDIQSKKSMEMER